MRKHRSQEIRKVIGPFKERWQSEPAADDGEDRENYQRAEHAPRRLVNVNMVLVISLPAVKGQKDKAEHIEGCEQRSEQAEGVKNRAAVFALIGRKEDGVLREKPGKEG